MKAHVQNPPGHRYAVLRWREGHPLLEVAIGLFGNLVIVGLFAVYPAQWFGLW